MLDRTSFLSGAAAASSISAAPTAADIAEGRDRALETALELL